MDKSCQLLNSNSHHSLSTRGRLPSVHNKPMIWPEDFQATIRTSKVKSRRKLQASHGWMEVAIRQVDRELEAAATATRR